ncbi:MAG: transcriptional repressor PurR [Chloroflexi bacterium HGW-Chloroflexi-5]|jgi:DNA-binding LacI/PurR family transcriptional regulator|nr:MAG: transcriptional repressor PurR [Chloroflexi bacterium HGW-Chloroflexi-5]
MATILDVAKLAGVSTATVSHVINKTRKVNPETIAKVEEAIQELRFQPNQQARSLKTGQSRLIGVLNYYTVDDYFAEILGSLETTAFNAGYNVLLRHPLHDDQRKESDLNNWINQNIDGLIINSPEVDDEYYSLLKNINCPCVILHVNDLNCTCDTIQINDFEISKEAIRYLITLGHKRIACISGYTNDKHTASKRRLGYEAALLEAGLTIPPQYLVNTDYGIEEGYQQCQTLLKLPQPPSAIFTYSDLLAIGAMRAAQDLGVNIPRDLSIIGFDDIALASYTTPRLTTIHQDKDLIGELAVKQLLKRIQNPDQPIEKIVLPTRLVIRESTAAVNPKLN